MQNFKPKLIKMILPLLVFITTLTLLQPMKTYAINMDGGNESAKVSSLYWGGTIARTGYIFYIVKSDGSILTAGDLGVENGLATDQYAVLVYKNDGRAMYFGAIGNSNRFFGTHFGNLYINAELPCSGVPDPVSWSEGDSTWSSNNDAVEAWLYTNSIEAPNSYNWEMLVAKGFDDGSGLTGAKALKNLKTLASSGNLTLVMEPVSAQAIYGNRNTEYWTASAWETYGPSIKQNETSYMDYVNANGGEENIENIPMPLIRNGQVHKILVTGRFGAEKNVRLVNEAVGTQFRSPHASDTDTFSSKWTNFAMPTSIMLEHVQFGRSVPPKPSAGEIIPSNAINDTKKGYAIAIFEAESLVPIISTYNGTATTPEKSEQPGEDNSGDCRIVKVYYDGEYNVETMQSTMTHIGTYTTTGTTGNIKIESERTQTGYSIDSWGAFKKKVKADQSNYLKFSAAVSKGNPKGKVEEIINIDDSLLGTDGVEWLYVIYIKIEPPEEEEEHAYDFEIPESYITKQVYFSGGKHTSNNPEANDLPSTDFTWESAKHVSCPSHQIVICGVNAPHTDTAQGTNANGKAERTCSFNYEHEHGTNEANCKYTQTVCNECGATSGWDLASNSAKALSHLSTCDKKDNSNVSTKSVYKGAIAEYTCKTCGRKAATANSITHKTDCGFKNPQPSKCGITEHTHKAWSSALVPGCYKTFYKCPNSGNVSASRCGHEVHLPSCYKTVTCQKKWLQRYPKLSLKNEWQEKDAYKTIISKVGVVFHRTGTTTSFPTISNIENGSASNTSLYVKFKRQNNAKKSKTGDIEGYDYTTILLRGKDQLTIAKWKTENDDHVDTP